LFVLAAGFRVVWQIHGTVVGGRQAGLEAFGAKCVEGAPEALKQTRVRVRMGHDIDCHSILAAVPWMESMRLKHLGGKIVYLNGPIISDWNLDAIMNDRGNAVWSTQFDHLRRACPIKVRRGR
jgi:hypothetical protein